MKCRLSLDILVLLDVIEYNSFLYLYLFYYVILLTELLGWALPVHGPCKHIAQNEA